MHTPTLTWLTRCIQYIHAHDPVVHHHPLITYLSYFIPHVVPHHHGPLEAPSTIDVQPQLNYIIANQGALDTAWYSSMVQHTLTLLGHHFCIVSLYSNK